MRVLFDTNVVLDVLLDREPHTETGVRLFTLVDTGALEGSLCAMSVTTIHYLAAKTFGTPRARRLLRELLNLFDVAPVDGRVIDRALLLDFADFEDAVLHEAAVANGATGIVTRDASGFARAKLPVFAPLELLAALEASGNTE